MLSILLPSYNNRCYPLVESLKRQADAIDGLQYEIIVADDGSRDQVCIISNYLINELEHCRYIRRQENVGRARIRNFLASQAKGEWLLFLDSDVSIVSDDFLACYLALTDKTQVVDGGVTVIGDPSVMRHNLRFWYEYESQPLHTAEKRSQTPYQHVHTANLLVPRTAATACPFDERFRRYGFEDVMFGKMLKGAGIPIVHIDNPVGLSKFESNESFVRKTEEAMRTLYTFQSELEGYSNVLSLYNRLGKYHLQPLMRLAYKALRPVLMHNLQGKHPDCTLFSIYKLLYFSTVR